MNIEIPKDKKEYLKSLEFFNNFGDDALTKIAESLELTNLGGGKIIFKEDDISLDIYIIISGEVVISKGVSPSEEKVLAVLGSKSVFGEMALFSNQPRTATARTKTFVNFFKLPAKKLREIFSTDPNGALKTVELFLLATLERMEQTSRELAAISEISKIICRNLPLDDFCQEIIKQLYYSIRTVDSGLIYLWNDTKILYDLHSGIEVKNPPQSIQGNHPLIRYLHKEAFGERVNTFIINDPTVAQQLLTNITPALTMLITRFVTNNKLFGFILLLNHKGMQHTTGSRDLLNSVGMQIIDVIENLKMKRG